MQARGRRRRALAFAAGVDVHQRARASRRRRGRRWSAITVALVADRAGRVTLPGARDVVRRAPAPAPTRTAGPGGVLETSPRARARAHGDDASDDQRRRSRTRRSSGPAARVPRRGGGRRRLGSAACAPPRRPDWAAARARRSRRALGCEFGGCRTRSSRTAAAASARPAASRGCSQALDQEPRRSHSDRRGRARGAFARTVVELRREVRAAAALTGSRAPVGGRTPSASSRWKGTPAGQALVDGRAERVDVGLRRSPRGLRSARAPCTRSFR